MRNAVLGPSWSPATGYKPDTLAVSVRNEDTFAIAPGTPVVLAASGTDDGIAIVNSSSSTAGNLDTLSMGIWGGPSNLQPNQTGKSVTFGMVSTLTVLGTRANSTAAYPSYGAIAIGDILSVASAMNALSRSGPGTVNGYGPYFVAMQSVASASGTLASSASLPAGVFATVLTTGSASSATINALCAGQSGPFGQGFKTFCRVS